MNWLFWKWVFPKIRTPFHIERKVAFLLVICEMPKMFFKKGRSSFEINIYLKDTQWWCWNFKTWQAVKWQRNLKLSFGQHKQCKMTHALWNFLENSLENIWSYTKLFKLVFQQMTRKHNYGFASYLKKRPNFSNTSYSILPFLIH